MHLADYKWASYLDRSYYFYEAQRSGALPADNRVKWRGNSCLNDTGPLGQDLAGGHYDAGGQCPSSNWDVPDVKSLSVHVSCHAWSLMVLGSAKVLSGH